MSSDTPKGRHHRCADHPWVGGVPTVSGEVVWRLVDGVPRKLRSRHQLGDDAETLVVTQGAAPTSNWFDSDTELPASAWRGDGSRSTLRRSAQRRVSGVRTAARAHPHLAARLTGRYSNSNVTRVRPAVDLGCDERTGQAVAGIADAVAARGGRALAVGGVVRDAVWGNLNGLEVSGKDVDVEVYGIEPHELRGILARSFNVDLVGEQFAVLKIGGLDIDVSIPRRESKAGAGHRGFTVQSDPHMTLTEAAARRDFTINAISMDLHSGEVIDPYGGVADLEARRLRHVGDQFGEDPLRVLRAAQFVSRFDLKLDDTTAQVCRSLRHEAATLPAERVWEETRKLVARGRRPGAGLHVLDQVDWIDVVHPQLAALRGVQQDPRWHPEGDVFVHTAHCLDYFAANLRSGDDEEDLIVAMAIAAHDLGKAATTEFSDGRWRAHAHEAAGVGPATEWISRRLGQVRLAEQVAPLVQYHLAPVQLHAAGAKDAAVRRLAMKVRIDRLVRVSWADQGGRPPLEVGDFPAGQWLLERAAAQGVTSGKPKPLVGGRHLIAEFDLKPGPQFKQLLDAAMDAQLEGEITTEEEGVEFLRRLLAAS